MPQEVAPLRDSFDAALVHAAERMDDALLENSYERVNDEIFHFASLIFNLEHDPDVSFCFSSQAVEKLCNIKQNRRDKFRVIDSRVAFFKDARSERLLLPLNIWDGQHWSLLVVLEKEKKMYCYDSLKPEGAAAGSVAPLPSPYNVLPGLFGVDAGDVIWLDTTRQLDGVSCGLFVLENMRKVAEQDWTPSVDVVQEVSITNTRLWLKENKRRVLDGSGKSPLPEEVAPSPTLPVPSNIATTPAQESPAEETALEPAPPTPPSFERHMSRVGDMVLFLTAKPYQEFWLMHPHIPLRERASRVFTWIFYHVVDYGPILDMNLHLLITLPSGVLNLLEDYAKTLQTPPSTLKSQSPAWRAWRNAFQFPSSTSSPTAQSPRVSSPTFLVSTPSGPFIDPVRKRKPKKVIQRSLDDQAKFNRMAWKRGEHLAKPPSAAWRSTSTASGQRRSPRTNRPPAFVPNISTPGGAVQHLDADLFDSEGRCL